MSDKNIKVQVLRDFKDGHEEFIKDETRFMDAAQAEKFKSYGWVSVEGKSDTPYVGERTLNIHNGILGQTAPKIGE
jgi:hypothetical protein